MSELSPDDSRALVAEARLAPSVHNIQPTRWRISGVTVDLLGDLARAVPVADPVGRDLWCRMVPLSKGSTSHSARGLGMHEHVDRTTRSALRRPKG